MPDRRTPSVGTRQRVDILHDPGDDAAVPLAIRRGCRPGSGRLVIAPTPGIGHERAVAVQVFLAHGRVPPPTWMPYVWCRRHRLGQLRLFPDDEGGDTAAGGEQLVLFPIADHVARLRASRSALTLDDAAHLLRCEGIRELYVLQAQALRVGTWSALRRLTAKSGTRLRLVVSGTQPMRPQLAALRGCGVHHRRISRPRAGGGRQLESPWWSRRTYRAGWTAATGRERLAEVVVGNASRVLPRVAEGG
jgi:hypothetical protein